MHTLRYGIVGFGNVGAALAAHAAARAARIADRYNINLVLTLVEDSRHALVFPDGLQAREVLGQALQVRGGELSVQRRVVVSERAQFEGPFLAPMGQGGADRLDEGAPGHGHQQPPGRDVGGFSGGLQAEAWYSRQAAGQGLIGQALGSAGVAGHGARLGVPARHHPLPDGSGVGGSHGLQWI